MVDKRRYETSLKWGGFESRTVRQKKNNRAIKLGNGENMNNEITLTIDGEKVDFIRKDAVLEQAEKLNGLDYAIVRSRNHGVMAGYVSSYDRQTVHLKNARRLWYFEGCKTLEELAVYGTAKIDKCKVSPQVHDTVMLEACGIIYCTKKTQDCIEGATEWKC